MAREKGGHLKTWTINIDMINEFQNNMRLCSVRFYTAYRNNSQPKLHSVDIAQARGWSWLPLRLKDLSSSARSNLHGLHGLRKRSAFNAWTSLGDLSLAALPAYCSIDQHCTLSVHCRLIPAVVIITNSHHDQHDHFQSPQRKAALSWYVLVGETSAYVLTSPKIEASNWEGL